MGRHYWVLLSMHPLTNLKTQKLKNSNTPYNIITEDSKTQKLKNSKT